MTHRRILTLGALAALTAGAASAESLQGKLDARRDAFLAQAPGEVIASQERALRELEGSGIYGRVLKVGDRAPDFTLGNAERQEVRLAELLKSGPVVLTWYRGTWCPYCNIALAGLAAEAPRFRDLGATLVALTPELPDHTAEAVREQGLPFEVLSDLGHDVAEDYGLVFQLDPETRERYESRFGLSGRNGSGGADRLPLPATYVIARDGIIHYAFVDADYRRRAEPDRIADALVAIRDGPGARHLLLQLGENIWNPPYDLDLIDLNLSEDFTLTGNGRPIEGRAAYKAWVRQAIAKARSLRTEILECFEGEDGTRAASHWTIQADAVAPAGSDAAPGEPMSVTEIALWAFADGLLTRSWAEHSGQLPAAFPD